jgi:hypothetical protein
MDNLGLIPVTTFEDRREEKQFNETFNCNDYGAVRDNLFLKEENHVS